MNTDIRIIGNPCSAVAMGFQNIIVYNRDQMEEVMQEVEKIVNVKPNCSVYQYQGKYLTNKNGKITFHGSRISKENLKVLLKVCEENLPKNRINPETGEHF